MIGGARLRQHVVEFIRGTGIVTDGIVDATSVNGPWNWTVPDGVATLVLEGCSAGGGGGGGFGTTVSRAGGGGGASGVCFEAYAAKTYPLSTLAVTLGAGGAAGAVGLNGSSGGDLTVSGFPNALALSAIMGAVGTLRIRGGGGGDGATSTLSGTGGNSGKGSINALGFSAGANGVANAASPSSGGLGSELTNTLLTARVFYSCGGSAGGAASTTGSTSGSGGGGARSSGGRFLNAWSSFSGGSSGNTDATTSYGGGGDGGYSVFGVGAVGGNGNASAAAGSGYGFGGGGGGGNAAGSAGGDSYLSLTYWSAD